ncbi:MAG: DnaD domain protein [Bacilli bacterium]|nr:DnaD domain protein [Bacilli bacterium]
MKNSKLIDIFKNGNIVVPLYLLKNYKELNIKIDEFIFLMYLYNLGDKFLFDPNKFSNDLGIDTTSIMNYIGILSDKNLIRVEVLKNDKNVMEEIVSLDNFYNKITCLTIGEVTKEMDNKDSNIFELIEKEFGRTLNSNEYEIIKAWLDNNYNEELIKEALKEATRNNVSNIRYIDKILYEWGKKDINTLEDLKKMKNKHNEKEEKDVEIDTEIFDWDWLNEEDE